MKVHVSQVHNSKLKQHPNEQKTVIINCLILTDSLNEMKAASRKVFSDKTM